MGVTVHIIWSWLQGRSQANQRRQVVVQQTDEDGLQQQQYQDRGGMRGVRCRRRFLRGVAGEAHIGVFPFVEQQ